MKGNVVQYNFLDVENEPYSLDYAIVLNSKDNNLILLPFTNDFKSESNTTLCIGKIYNFINVDNDNFVEKNCSVLLDKIREVKKNSINQIYQQSLDGSMIKDQDDKFVPVKINSEQFEYIEEKIKELSA